LILRWYWWRISAWSEIAAMIAPFAGYAYVRFFTSLQFPESLFLIVSFTTVVWVVVTFLTKPTSMETLKAFFTRVHPGGAWKPVADQLPSVVQDTGLGKLAVDWAAGVVLIYNTLFGLGKLFLGETQIALMFFLIAAAAATILYRHLSKIGWEKVAE
jgi:hypothetical protein